MSKCNYKQNTVCQKEPSLSFSVSQEPGQRRLGVKVLCDQKILLQSYESGGSEDTLVANDHLLNSAKAFFLPSGAEYSKAAMTHNAS